MKDVWVTCSAGTPPAPNGIERRPLHREATTALRQWLQGQTRGTRLPAERRLALQMGVSRPTLRKALAELLRTREIERLGRKTFVGRRTQDPEPFLDGHPFIYASVSPRRQTTVLHMAIFETLASQKRCWARLRDRFNATHDHIELLVQDLPTEVNGTAQYADFIQQQKPDLILMQPAMLVPLRDAGLLRPLPAPAVDALRSGEYLWPTLRSGGPGDADTYGLPLHCGFFVLAWNTALTGEGLVPPNGVVDALTAAQWYRRAAAVVPVDRWVAANPADLVAAVGYDFDAWSLADVTTYIERAVDVVVELMATERSRFACAASDRRFGMRAFAEGRSAFVSGPSYLLLDILGSARVPWRAAVAMPPPPCQAPTGATFVGVTAGPDRATEACEVVRFLISEAGQTIVGEERLNCPMRKDSVAPLAHFLGLDPDRFLPLVGRLRMADRGLPVLWDWFTHFVIMPYMNEAIEKSRRPDREAMVAELKARLPRGAGAF